MSYENDTKTVIDNEFTQPSLRFNSDDYRQDLATFGMTHQQEDELLETLWNIMKNMVEIGWGVNNVQYLLPDIFETASADSIKTNQPKFKGRNTDD